MPLCVPPASAQVVSCGIGGSLVMVVALAPVAGDVPTRETSRAVAGASVARKQRKRHVCKT